MTLREITRVRVPHIWNRLANAGLYSGGQSNLNVGTDRRSLNGWSDAGKMGEHHAAER
ncbi:MAG: hypothetical protein L7W43_04220 [Rubripirellula sp.]|nr:hypothetical protein [Rubripirellula sp.]